MHSYDSLPDRKRAIFIKTCEMRNVIMLEKQKGALAYGRYVYHETNPPVR